MMQLTLPEISRFHALLFGIHVKGSNMNVSEYLYVDLGTVQKLENS